ncbi:hypothetical protein ACWCXE_05095 [Streptomyces sp. NPDC001780]
MSCFDAAEPQASRGRRHRTPNCAPTPCLTTGMLPGFDPAEPAATGGAGWLTLRGRTHEASADGRAPTSRPRGRT